ncbi:MAG: oxygen-independent coproporphyrinogen III oxidase [Bacteroidetes bacterium]|nr:oxygen-independent coproporphyrinogen III oxidase [Bacteroidota bacterium]MBU1717863.1 oxygen-independent coproporphyrinogen III oxidase [Bacteroidota bacterium]
MQGVPDLLLKYNRQGPRYTSYPPATSFHNRYKPKDYKEHLIASNIRGDKNISVYIHIPFCFQRCCFCGCNSSLFENNDLLESYMAALLKEIETVTGLLDTSHRPLTQIHWGGGTPNMLSTSLIERVMDFFATNYNISTTAEISIECNPAYLDYDYVRFLAKTGFNRISLGIQDFDPKVLKAANRLPSKLPIGELFGILRNENFEEINLDFIYGLPYQTSESFRETLLKAVDLSPDRIVTFSYAHVPWLMPEQKKMEHFGLPDPNEKLAIFLAGFQALVSSGYQTIGLDHFAKPDDKISLALKNKKLHRNFQGYCTKETTGQVYAFGSSAISQLWNAYSQNIKPVKHYIDSIESTQFAVDRGYELSSDEMVCSTVINSIMCNGFVNFRQVADMFGLTASDVVGITGYKPERIQEFIDDGLISVFDDHIEINQTGMMIARNIAMVFDPQLSIQENKYSKTI